MSLTDKVKINSNKFKTTPTEVVREANRISKKTDDLILERR